MRSTKNVVRGRWLKLMLATAITLSFAPMVPALAYPSAEDELSGVLALEANSATPDSAEQRPDKADVDAYCQWLISLDNQFFMDNIESIYGEGALVDYAASLANSSEEEIEKFVASQKAVILLLNSRQQARELTQQEKDYIAYMQELVFGESSPEYKQGAASLGDVTALSGNPNPGDSNYVYNGPSVGIYPSYANFVKGRILVTSDLAFGVLPTGHAAITYSKNDNKAVTSLVDGVTLEDNNWNTRHATCFVVDVISTTPAQDANIADWCRTQVGKPYNFNFINTDTRSEFYCSQLIWAGYLDVLGINLDTDFLGRIVYPMELAHTPLTKLLYQHGIVDTGWVTIEGKKYFLDLSGKPKTGLQFIGGKFYYFNSSGVMQTGSLLINGYSSQFDEDGAYVKTKGINYQPHVAGLGWLSISGDGNMAGTVGQSRPMEAIAISIENEPASSGAIQYRTHVAGYGWLGWQGNGIISGTTGQARQMEAIEIVLNGEVAANYDVYYRAHVAGYGWLDWVANGDVAGTTGQSRSLQAVQISLVQKGSGAPSI